MTNGISVLPSVLGFGRVFGSYPVDMGGPYQKSPSVSAIVSMLHIRRLWQLWGALRGGLLLAARG